jgi:tetratricopeptide (TPR) repeat protein
MAANPAARYGDIADLLAALAADPRARRRKGVRRAAVAALVLVAAGAAWWGMGRSARLCGGAEARLTGVWDEARRQAVAQAFSASRAPFAAAAWASVGHALDAYGTEWVAARTDACEATRRRGEQSEALLDRRMNCLDGRLEDFAALSDLLAAADARLVETSVQAVYSLPPIAACGDRETLLARVPPPADVSARRRVDQARQGLARVRALRIAGRYAAGLEAATAMAPAVEREKYQPLRAEYLLERADLEQRLGDFAASEATLHEALWAAEAGRDDGVATEVASLAVMVVGIRQARHAEALRWGNQALALLEGLGGDERLEGMVRTNLGTLHSKIGDGERAERELLASLALRERVLGANSPDVGRTLNNLGTVYYLRGDLEHALQAYDRALAVKESTRATNIPS